MPPPSTLARDISPPPSRRSSGAVAEIQRKMTHERSPTNGRVAAGPSLAAVEAGDAQVRDHLAYFSKHLQEASRETPTSSHRMTIDGFQDLYKRNQHLRGHHFVIHQHDHPVAGTHYDLRLQYSETSTVSFAVPYGMPGNPNSIRPNRMAIETRVHNLWNNLIESASHATGSLLIWDTGEYEVLPYRDPIKAHTTDDELSDSEDDVTLPNLSDSEKLFAGFQSRHLRLQLHGTKLPKGYTIGLRLPSANDRSAQPNMPKRKRRRKDPAKENVRPIQPPMTDSEDGGDQDTTAGVDAVGNVPDDAEGKDAGRASEAEDEDATIRANNAYTGAANTIGSVHQRHWFLSLDRKNSGFSKARSGDDVGRWVGGWDPFIVFGRDVERSVVTGRNADEVMADEGVERFMGRKMWRPITE
ncbi:hypothetical protein Q7P37_003991 [Cladosporium fusiforme]